MENDSVNHPSHYEWLREKCGIEVIDITRHMNFDLGNAVKYILRAGKKCLKKDARQAKVEDLRKAIWYINDEIARFTKNNPELSKNSVCANNAHTVKDGKIEFHTKVSGIAFGESYKEDCRTAVLTKTTHSITDGSTEVGSRNTIGIRLDLVTYVDGYGDIKTCYEVVINGSRNLKGFCPTDFTTVYTTYHTDVTDLIKLVSKIGGMLPAFQDVVEAEQFFEKSVNLADLGNPDPEHLSIEFKKCLFSLSDAPDYEVYENVLVRYGEFCSISVNKLADTIFVSILKKTKEVESKTTYSTKSSDIDTIVDFVYTLPSDSSDWSSLFEHYFKIAPLCATKILKSKS